MSELPVYLPTSPAVQAQTAQLLAEANTVLTLPWRVLALTGADALTFLQGQVTTDMREVDETQSRLGCLLNLKGRVQITFRAVACEQGYHLLMPDDQIAPTLARLSKFAVFSKVKIAEVPLRVRGVVGAGAISALTAAGWTWPLLAQGVSHLAETTLIRLPGHDRALLLDVEPVTAAATAAELAAWHSAAISAGEILLPAAASERYQPQEIDYHQLLGVSYQKGCYMGQEIVARLYFRGQLKTALMRFQADWPATGDAPLSQNLAMGLAISAGGKSVGEVVSASWPAPGRVELLALVKLAAVAKPDAELSTDEAATDSASASSADSDLTPTAEPAAPLPALVVTLGEHVLTLTQAAFERSA